MKSLLKTAVMQLYCRGLIGPSTVLRMFDRFNLWSA